MKDFILRNVPLAVHADWKHFAQKSGKTMRAYILLALMQKIDRDKVKAGEENV